MHYHLNDCHESQLLPACLIRGKYTSNLILKYIFWLGILLCAKKIRSRPGGQCCGFVARRFPKRGGPRVLSRTEFSGLLKRTAFHLNDELTLALERERCSSEIIRGYAAPSSNNVAITSKILKLKNENAIKIFLLLVIGVSC